MSDLTKYLPCIEKCVEMMLVMGLCISIISVNLLKTFIDLTSGQIIISELFVSSL